MTSSGIGDNYVLVIGESVWKSNIIVSSFYMSRYEVTVAKFQTFINESRYKTTAEKNGGAYVRTGGQVEQKSDANWRNPYMNQTVNDPVTCVSWYDAVEYCNWLSWKEGLPPCYSVSGGSIKCNFNGNGYRLPTHAEWGFAASGGNRSKDYIWSGSNSIGNVAWYGGNSGGKTHQLGMKQANELGLYDMSGNTWEWCWDWLGTSSGSQIDPKGPSSGSLRMLCGGSWNDNADDCRVNVYGTGGGPYDSGDTLGFRMVRRP